MKKDDGEFFSDFSYVERNMATRRITIDPITRFEGHGKIEIFLDEEGDVANTYFQIPELRGFERFCIGRPVEEMPLLTNRICGVCPESAPHGGSQSGRCRLPCRSAVGSQKLRELLSHGFYFTDHIDTFLRARRPRFCHGTGCARGRTQHPGRDYKVGLEIGGKVIEARRSGHRVVEMLGARKVHPATSVPGGVLKGLTESERVEIKEDCAVGN